MATTKNISNSVSGGKPRSTGRSATTDNGQSTTDPKIWLSVDFDRIDYRDAWELQGNLIMARKERILPNDIVLILEHPAVFTLGRRGGRECLLVSDEFLEKAGVQVIQVERGGNITFHGPGQLVVYPIIDLQTAGIKVCSAPPKTGALQLNAMRPTAASGSVPIKWAVSGLPFAEASAFTVWH
jgi:hypothetical protein